VTSKRVHWTGHVTRWEKQRMHNRILVGKPVGKQPLGRMRLEDNVKMDLKVIGMRMGVERQLD
jgi:hypothetical protein